MLIMDKLLDIMVRLRHPESGCPWDRAQTFKTIAPYTIEEAYEVADAIDRKNLIDLKDELGDLLLQVVYHARMAEEANAFDFSAVVETICDKMTRRHPHVFGNDTGLDPDLQTEAWEVLKRSARIENGDSGVLGGIPKMLPALTKAAKLGRRAALVGFDWPGLAGPRAKLDEELTELDEAISRGDRKAVSAEMGDALFSLVNVCRHLKLDPETCLRDANVRFIERFNRVEEKVGKADGDWQAFDSDRLESFWQEAKAET